jgi:crotonobetainyl-CoA:carnitine CoA-transferase CaiB-like acyl-CoA transferase
VIRIENAQRPCVNRLLPPFFEGKPGINRGGGFNQWNQGKRSLQLDLAHPKAIEIVRRLGAQTVQRGRGHKLMRWGVRPGGKFSES